MKYTQEIEINRPIDEVVALFKNPENLYKWMDGLQSYQQLSGVPGQPGAKSKLEFKMGKREIEMVEIIKVNDLPEEFTATYEAKGVFNVISNKFIELPDGRTRYITENEFRFKGFMKLMGWLMPGAFKKQSWKYMLAFKEFVEDQK
ncbi:MAG: SRPBCC family protein [Salinimicrobium sp.]